MERREDIRAAMHSLLSPAKRRDDPPLTLLVSEPSVPEPVTEPASSTEYSVSDEQVEVLEAMRITLREFGVNADPQEIMGAMMEALFARPMLCRGLLAAYLTERRSG